MAMDTGVVPTDEKGRPLVEHMTTEAKLNEILLHLRSFNDALEQVSQSPMLSMMGVRFQ